MEEPVGESGRVRLYRITSYCLFALGIAGLLVGFVVGGFQVTWHDGLYHAGRRGVTLDRVYAVAYFWCFWLAVSIGYFLAAQLCRYQSRTGLIGGCVLVVFHVGLVIDLLIEIGWL